MTTTTDHAFPAPIGRTDISSGQRRPGPVVYAILALWVAAAVAFEASGALAAAPDEAPIGLLVGAAVPLALFGLALGTLEPVKRFASELDLGLLTAFQSWRVVGAMFLAFYALNQMPGIFAWPAGAGDVLVGLAAPFAVIALLRRSTGWQAQVRWLNYAGLFDFVIAFATGLLVSDSAFGLLRDSGGLSSGLMTQWPLSLFPTFGVPLFIIMHWISLRQLNQMSQD
jgi:hypothetical protein